MRLDHQTLTTKTVVSLKQFARENGIRIPAGSLKGQIIDLIEKSLQARAQKETEENKCTNEAGTQKDAPPAVCLSEDGSRGRKDFPLMRRANVIASPNLPRIPGACSERTADTKNASGVLEIQPEGYGFLRRENFLPGKGDIYVSNQHIKRFGLRNGDLVEGTVRPQRENDKYEGLSFVSKVNAGPVSQIIRRVKFDALTPVYPFKRIYLEKTGEANDLSLRFLDLMAPVGKGQRGMIVSPPKAGKTTLLKLIAKSIQKNNPEIHLIMLLIDERPEEVTDIRREISGECVYSTFDERPENHVRLSEMTLERAKRLVEAGKDVVILMDSITRLARAYNLVIPPTGRSLSGGLDPGALHKPKRFFGSARAIENGGSLTILATALIETGSRMDDIIYEEFKGTGNMEVHLDRKLSEKRIFPAVDLLKSGTRRDDLLTNENEQACAQNIRKLISLRSGSDMTEQLISLMEKTKDNAEFALKMKGWVDKWQKEGYHLG
ncbi:MAG: transcription termination factor Rho [Clostridia bacterium]|nr:transcription termination factor Rho [Clostridia bacterium]